MRFGLIVGILAGLTLVIALLVPARSPTLLSVPGPTPPPPALTSCLSLTYQGSGRLDVLPNSVTLQPDSTSWVLGRRTYRASGNGDPLWKDAFWSYAGLDSIDITAHHQPIMRLPIRAGRGRGIPYRDGPLLPSLLSPERQFTVVVTPQPCVRERAA